MMNPDGTFQEDIQLIVPQENGVGAIYISNLQAASNPQTLKYHNIGAVITAIKGKNLSSTIPNHIQYLYIPVVDHQSCDISPFFKDSYEFIESERKRTNVLVHCMAGVSRSVTLVIAYIMQKSKIDFSLAYKYVKTKRKIIHPNEAFIRQLKDLEQRIFLKTGARNEEIVQKREDRQKNRLCQTAASSSGFNINLGKSQATLKQSYKKQEQNCNFGMIRSAFYPNKTQQNTKGFLPKSQLQQNEYIEGKQNGEIICKQSQQRFFGLKTGQNNDNKAYDKMLKENIKKLFSLNNSRIKSTNC